MYKQKESILSQDDVTEIAAILPQPISSNKIIEIRNTNINIHALFLTLIKKTLQQAHIKVHCYRRGSRVTSLMLQYRMKIQIYQHSRKEHNMIAKKEIAINYVAL